MPFRRRKKKEVEAVSTEAEIPVDTTQQQQEQPPQDPCAYYRYLVNELLNIMSLPENERNARLIKLFKYVIGLT